MSNFVPITIQSSSDISHVLTGGSFDYDDQATKTTSQLVTSAGGAIIIPNDTLGPNTKDAFAPNGVTRVFDPDLGTVGEFTWDELKLGDEVGIRLHLGIETLSPNTRVHVELVVGTGGATYTLPWADKFFSSAESDHFIFESDILGMDDLNTLNNGGVFQLTTDKNINMTVQGWRTTITQRKST